MPAFFSALHALAVDDGGGGTGLAFALLAALHIQGVMDAIERAVVAPQIKIVEKRAAWRQIFRNRPPLASRAQHIHDPVHHLAHVDKRKTSVSARPEDSYDVNEQGQANGECSGGISA